MLKLKTWKSSLISLFLESYLTPSPPLIYQQITTILSSSCIFSYSTEVLYSLPSPNCHNHASGLFTAGPQMVSVSTPACSRCVLQSGSQSGGGTGLGPERKTMRPGSITVRYSHCTGSEFKPLHHGLHGPIWTSFLPPPPLLLHCCSHTGLLRVPVPHWALFRLPVFTFVIFATFYSLYFHMTSSFSSFSTCFFFREAFLDFPLSLLVKIASEFPWKHLTQSNMISFICWHTLSFTGRM